MKIAKMLMFGLPTVAALAAVSAPQSNSLSDIQKAAGGKPLVIFYVDVSPAAYPGGLFSVAENGVTKGRLWNQSYLVLAVEPGGHSYATAHASGSAVQIEAQDGQVYFVRAEAATDRSHSPDLRVSNADEMAKSISVLRNVSQPEPTLSVFRPVLH